jgi:tetratricopeptide (TPR) repeat protein
MATCQHLLLFRLLLLTALLMLPAMTAYAQQACEQLAPAKRTPAGSAAKPRMGGLSGDVVQTKLSLLQEADCFNGNGRLFHAAGRLAEARNAFAQALRLRTQTLDAYDPLVAETQNNLGVIVRLQGRPAEAEKLFQQALGILRKNDPQHLMPGLYNNLAQAADDQGRWKQARDLYKDAVAAWEKTLGMDHPNVAAGLTNLAMLLHAHGKDEDAEKLLIRARAIDARAFAKSDPRIAMDLNNAAVLAVARKKYMQAEELLEMARQILELNVRQQRIPIGQSEFGQVLANLGQVWFLEHRVAESVTVYRQGMEILESNWGPENPRLLPWLDDYARVLHASEEFGEAERVRLRATRIRVAEVLRKNRSGSAS